MSFRVEAVNDKHDAGGYDRSRYKREIYNGNSLYEAFLKAKKGSSWKSKVQSFEMNWLIRLSFLQKALRERTYEPLPTSDFRLCERGKERWVSCEQIEDRIVTHSLCDEKLLPALKPYLIYDNTASLKNRGIDMCRKRLLIHLRRYYQRHGSNEGYILLLDYSKYYDNIRHKDFLELVEKYEQDELTIWLLKKKLERSMIDVSYMSDDEYANCMDKLFNSLEYSKIPKEKLTGQKYMPKHLNIGDQVAQIAGISYPIAIDNYVKIVRGVKEYARYSDDSYAIHESKEFLESLRDEIIAIGKKHGITVNEKKTRIVKLSDKWRFLQIQYSLTETGKVIRKIHPKRITAHRRVMKKLVKNRVLSPKEFTDWHYSWFKSHYKIMSRKQRKNLDILFDEQKEKLKCMK